MQKEELVPRAALWLDKKRPGWAEEIDLDSLDMINGDRCISGQLFGDHTWKSTGHEFSKDIGVDPHLGENVFASYDAEWHAQVRIRLPLARKIEIENATPIRLQRIAQEIENGDTSGEGWRFI